MFPSKTANSTSLPPWSMYVLLYSNYTGAMNPMINNMKNYRFSLKCDGKSLRWSFTPFYNCNGNNRVVVFRADAIPQFIKDRYVNNKKKL